MENGIHTPIAIVGVGAVLPDAPNVATFWTNVKNGRQSITEVTPERWDPALYYDANPTAPDKTYSKIGGWVREFIWDPLKWHFPIPPRVVDAMDEAQKWAIACTREALEDYGYPERQLDLDRTAVILGNAMAGEHHYMTALRLYFPEYVRELAGSSSFATLPDSVRRQITSELQERVGKRLPNVTEDTMPGELANCIAGRIANLFNFHGPNFVVDAACASAMAAFTAAAEGLIHNQFDFAITGGIDRNMGASTFIKFSKIGALSATGTRPYAEGADGFVMGEGTALFLLRRLADAERDGDKIYAVLRGIAGSSDGKGKGITAPNPIGQKLCTERAWKNAGLSPATVTMIEGHGTSTRVGDVVEVQSLTEVLKEYHLPFHSVALGSVKSNLGHLKGAAGAAGILKTVLALRDKVLPPSVHCDRPNPDIDFAGSPLFVNTTLQPWIVAKDAVRRAGVSAFGFGGTNFHVVLEEFVPGMLKAGNGKHSVAVSIPSPVVSDSVAYSAKPSSPSSLETAHKIPLRGAMVIGASNEAELVERLQKAQKSFAAGHAPEPAIPNELDLRAPERIAIDYADVSELGIKATAALKGLVVNQPAVWKALRAQGIFRGHGPAPKVAFLYTGQGSQYVNMLRLLRDTEPIVAETFSEADRIMTPLLPKPLSEFIFVDPSNTKAIEQAEEDLRQTAITQPAVLATDLALTKLFAAYGIRPDMTMGHSLGEYGALVASGVLSFDDALEAVSARGREMTQVAMEDNGRMAAVFAPLAEIERVLKTVKGYVVIANINSNSQAVIGGASEAVGQAIEVFLQAGFNAVPLPVSHAFHTSIVAPASEPLRLMLRRFHLQSPRIPVVANATGEFYPEGPAVSRRILDLLSRQVASPVRFVQGLQTLYRAGSRVFVEVGPKKALQGFADDVLGSDASVVSLFSNHPKFSDIVAFNQALCGLYAAGLGHGSATRTIELSQSATESTGSQVPVAADVIAFPTKSSTPSSRADENRFPDHEKSTSQNQERSTDMDPVVITGAAVGLPGTDHIFDDGNLARILRGEQFIDVIPTSLRQAMLDKNVTRLVKSDNAGPTFESIDNVADVIKLAGRGKYFDLEKQYGISGERVAAFDRTTKLAIAAGIDALRDAGIPLVMRYKSTTKGTQLPDRWGLADDLRDETGVIFASAFPGFDSYADEMSRYYGDHAHREQLTMLENLRDRVAAENGHSTIRHEIQRRIDDLRAVSEKSPYVLDRKFLLRALPMGHSQFAELIGARGPNTQINSACASTPYAMAIAEDWIRAGRCRRVIIVSADDVTSDHLIDWFGAAFLASGAAATDENVSDAAIPFDRRRHGMIMGMGAAALVIESTDAARERGIQPICEVLSTVTANSAFHATRLSLDHIRQVMENLMTQAESRHGIHRDEAAPRMMFVSHETYTPARGGSASAEINALRKVFGDAADKILIANTKGFTGHAMATGIEDVVAVKALETGCVPPVPNFKEVDPELGNLNLSKGGYYPIEYALRLGAGFGSQISMVLLRWIKTKDEVRVSPNALGYFYRITDRSAWDAWISRVSGCSGANLEIVNRTLRIRDERAAARLIENTKHSAAAAVATTMAEVVPVAVEMQPPAVAKVMPIVAPKLAEPHTPVPVPAPVERVDDISVQQKILALVAEKTGYPEDMLDLDLDLEADLGVDTVKQAEVFAAVREIYNIPRDTDLKLRDFPTLAHVIRFVHDRRPDLNPAKLAATIPIDAPTQQVVKPEKVEQVSPVAEVASPSQLLQVDGVKERILALVVEKTGYPQDMLDLDLDLEADLGVDTVKQAEMFAAIREIYNIPRDADLKLRDFPTLAHVIQFVYNKRPDLARGLEKRTPAAVVSEVPATPPMQPPSVIKDDSITDTILDIVAEKTGYPKDMLDLDLDLEADLGIDTVKQAEMFAAVRAAYNIPRKEDLKLRDFPTLAHVIKFARDARPSTTPAETPSTVPSSQRPVIASFDAADTIPRRIPVPVLRPPLSICKPTAVKLNAGSRVVVMMDKGGVGETLSKQLSSMGVEVLRVETAITTDALTKLLNTWLTTGPISGIYWLPALDDEGPLTAMDTSAWHEALRIRLKLLYAAMRFLYPHISAPNTFLIAATGMGGQHGYEAAGASAPLGGAVVGFTKAYKRERSDALVKSIDFPANGEPSAVAKTLIDETLRDPGAVEIGCKNGLRWTVGLTEQPALGTSPGICLDKNTVFLVTGAAGSIVSAITADLAAASGGTFYLFDIAPAPDANNSDIQRFVSDKDGLKRDLFARIQARGERATPALVEKELASLERAHAALSAIQAIRDCGGTAHYFSVDLTDPTAVRKVIDTIRKDSGHIDVLLHAAGMERSHLLPDKEPREFDLVFGVKADSWFNVLHAIGAMPLGITVAFSSIAGRFGNAGQTDYSSANDLLCKLTSNFRTTRPNTRAIAIDWTAWGGIGMATRGSIPKMMELAGIDMLPPTAAIPIVRRELTTGNSSGEVVIAQRLGALLNEWDGSGGVDPQLTESSPSFGPMVGKIVNTGIYSGVTIETTLDPKLQPFLNHHRIDDTPVLPGVMGMEAFAEAAVSIAPDYMVVSMEDVNFLAPLKFYRDEPRTITVRATHRLVGDDILTECQLVGSRILAGQAQPQVTTHFTGQVRLTTKPRLPILAFAPRLRDDSWVTASEIYHIYFHGPAYQVLGRACREGKFMMGELAKNLPANHHPAEGRLIVEPRLIELCFQTAGLLEIDLLGHFGLPLHVDRLDVWSDADFKSQPLFAMAKSNGDATSFDVNVVDQTGRVYVRLTGYHTIALPGVVDREWLTKLHGVAV